MPHQSHTTTLRRGAEKCHFGIAFFQFIGIVLHRGPSSIRDGFLKIAQIRHLHMVGCVYFHKPEEAHL